jgi:hypothetical protein
VPQGGLEFWDNRAVEIICALVINIPVPVGNGNGKLTLGLRARRATWENEYMKKTRKTLPTRCPNCSASLLFAGENVYDWNRCPECDIEFVPGKTYGSPPQGNPAIPAAPARDGKETFSWVDRHPHLFCLLVLLASLLAVACIVGPPPWTYF